MAAFSDRMLVWSAMSLIRDTMSPISWEDSPRRLIRFEVSWICSRMSSMPLMVFCTTSAPFLAMDTERSATEEDSEALDDTWSMDTAILVDGRGGTGNFLGLVLLGCLPASCFAVDWVSSAEEATRTAVSRMDCTRLRIWSMA